MDELHLFLQLPPSLLQLLRTEFALTITVIVGVAFAALKRHAV
jgi:hypothetical protein